MDDNVPNEEQKVSVNASDLLKKFKTIHQIFPEDMKIKKEMDEDQIDWVIF